MSGLSVRTASVILEGDGLRFRARVAAVREPVGGV
jgi:hypothetical protein